MKTFHNHPDNPEARHNFYMPRDTGVIDEDNNPIIAYDLEAEDTSDANTDCLRSLKRKVHEGIAEFKLFDERIEISWNDIIVAKADLVAEVWAGGGWQSQAFNFATANITKVDVGTFRCVWTTDIPALGITGAVFGLEWEFGQGFTGKQTFYLDFPGKLVRIKWRTEVRKAALAANREDGRGLRYSVDDYTGAVEHTSPTHPDPLWSYNIWTFEPDGYTCDVADARTPAQRYADSAGFVVDPYLSVDETATYIDVSLSSTMQYRVYTNTTAYDTLQNGATKLATLYYGSLKNGATYYDMHDDPSYTVSILEDSPVRVVIKDKGNPYNVGSTSYLTNLDSIERYITIYQSGVIYIDYIFTASGNVTITNSNENALMLLVESGGVFQHFYGTSTSETDGAATINPATDSYVGLRSSGDSVGYSIHAGVNNPTGFVVANYSQTASYARSYIADAQIDSGTHHVTLMFLIDEGLNLTASDRYARQSQYKNTTGATIVDTLGSLVTDLNIPSATDSAEGMYADGAQHIDTKSGFNKPEPALTLDYSHPLVENMVTCIVFNEGSGTTAKDLINDVDYTLDATNTPTWNEDGLNFSSADDYLSKTTNSNLDMGNSSFSIAAKVAMSAESDTQYILCHNYLAGTGAPPDYAWWALSLYNDGGTYYAAANLDDGTTYSSMQNDLVAFDDNLPHSIVMVRDRVTSNMWMFTDGTIATGADTSGSIATSSPTTTIGTRVDLASTRDFIGDLHYIYVWKDRILTPEEAISLHENPYQIFKTHQAKLGFNQTEINPAIVLHNPSIITGVSLPTPTGHWKMEDNAASSVITAQVGGNGTWRNMSDGTPRNTNTSGDSVGAIIGSGFDTQGGNAGYAEFPSGVGTPFDAAFMNKGTIKMRLYPQHLEATATWHIYLKIEVDANYSITLLYAPTTDEFRFRYELSASLFYDVTHQCTVDADVNIPIIWYCSWDLDKDIMTMSFNGTVYELTTVTTAPSASHPTYAGTGEADRSNTTTDFILDELRVYDEYIHPNNIEHDCLIGHWKCDDNEASSRIRATAGSDAEWVLGSTLAARNTDNDAVANTVLRGSTCLSTQALYGIVLPSAYRTNALFRQGSVTFSFTPQWAYTVASYLAIFHFKNLTAGDENHLQFYYNYLTDTFIWRSQVGTAQVTVDLHTEAYTSNAQLQCPHKVHLWWDLDQHIFGMDVNGKVTTGVNSGTPTSDTPGQLHYGMWASGTTTNNQNLLDEITLYDRALLPYGTVIPGNVIDAGTYGTGEVHSDVTCFIKGDEATGTGLKVGTGNITLATGVSANQTDVWGNANSAFRIDASSEYVSIGTTGNFNKNEGAISLWMKSIDTTPPTYGGICCDSDSFTNFGIYRQNNSELWFDGVFGSQLLNTSDLWDQKWHFVICKWSVSGVYRETWVDGILYERNTGTFTTAIGASTTLLIGNLSNLTNPLDADICDITIYNNPNTPQLPVVLGAGPAHAPLVSKNQALLTPGTDYQLVWRP